LRVNTTTVTASGLQFRVQLTAAAVNVVRRVYISIMGTKTSGYEDDDNDGDDDDYSDDDNVHSNNQTD